MIINISCRREDTEFIEIVKSNFDDVKIKPENSVIGVETWIMIGISLTQLTLQAIAFFKDYVNKKPDRELVTKDGHYPMNCDTDEEIKEELESFGDQRYL